MLKKKTLTETIYNNGDPFQIREAISATIGAWQKQEKYDILWDTLEITTGTLDEGTWFSKTETVFELSIEAVYDDSME